MNWFHKKSENLQQEAKEPCVTPHIDHDASQDTDMEKSRFRCYEKLTEVIENANNKSKGVVLKFYIENFKRLNDVFGYEYCEHLLEQILEYLRKKTGSEVYRYIGVEFIIVMEQVTQGQALALAEEIGEHFDHVWKVDGTDCLCSVQIGLCSYPGIPSDADQMLKCLDTSLNKAGEFSANRAIMYDSQLHNLMLRKQQIAVYLQTAIDNSEIEVRYRPTYNLETEKFTRIEYYMRIFIQGIGLVGTGEFLPIAEDSGQIRAVEYFALDQVGSLIADLIATDVEFESVALPISPILFLQEDFLEELDRVIKKYNIPMGKLALEFDESALVTAYSNVMIMMNNLVDMGIELIFSNFGSSFSGLNNILELPINTLKFERLFIWQLETHPKSGYVIDSLTKMARSLDLKIIAEGVETENQVSLLTSYGCNYQQGFYYGPTMEKDILMRVIGTSLKESEAIIQNAKKNPN